jgi:hypothetical protein
MWAIVDYMYYLANLEGSAEDAHPEAPYENQMTAVPSDEELDLAAMDLARSRELFANAPRSMFPIVGQIIEPGRNFYPSVYAINAQAVYNDDDILIKLTWNDMRAETFGTNAPDLAAALWDDELAALGLDTPAGGDEDDGGDFWGTGDDTADAAGGEEDFWGVEEEEDTGGDGGDDFWGVEEDDDSGGGDDFWGEDEDSAPAGPSGPDFEFNDAVALQFPMAMPTGIRRPYFLFGDAQNPVDIWFHDLGADRAVSYVGRGSAALAPSDGEAPASWKSFDQGEWTVIFKRERRGRGTISFDEGTFVPIAFSVWDGFNRERGNKRGLTGWRYVYMEPREEVAWMEPVAKTFGAVLLLELIVVGLVRLRRKQADASAEAAAGRVAPG